MTNPRLPYDRGPIRALLPRTDVGHQFVVYADACSGIPGALHERNLAEINAVAASLSPPPELICFPGDEIQGLTTDDQLLEQQWRHFLTSEMAWVSRAGIPLYNTTGNHTTYDAASEAVFARVLRHPRNGPAGQEGLAYYVERDGLLMVFCHTCPAQLGGEGRVETEWLDSVLRKHSGVPLKLVFGHHPVFSVNGFSGRLQREIEPDNGHRFWNLLVQHGVMAYVCSHVLAFDVSVERGVLQLLTAGAGTDSRMPEETEYLHCVQAAIDTLGLRYQVLDRRGRVREWLRWPFSLPPAATWSKLEIRGQAAEQLRLADDTGTDRTSVVALRIRGTMAPDHCAAQTLLCGWDGSSATTTLWIGLAGAEQRLTVLVARDAGRSPHTWLGPKLSNMKELDLQLALHTGMGPGGILHRRDDSDSWSSLEAASPWGLERVKWPTHWSAGTDQRGAIGRVFAGSALAISLSVQHDTLAEMFGI